jgi:hypothetical protein
MSLRLKDFFYTGPGGKGGQARLRQYTERPHRSFNPSWGNLFARLLVEILPLFFVIFQHALLSLLTTFSPAAN